jgi:hypothetical protein
LLAQAVPDGIGIGLHAAATLALLDARFDLVEDRTEAKRRKDLEDARISKSQSVTDFISEVANLISRVHELNPGAYPQGQQIIRLCDGLTNGEMELGMLVQGIYAFKASSGNQMTFQMACDFAKEWDASQSGRDRIQRAGMRFAAMSPNESTRCFRCGLVGHKIRDCPNERKNTPVPDGNHVAPVTLDRAESRATRKCTKCGRLGHTVESCWAGNPRRKQAFYERRNSARGGGASRSAGGPGEKYGGGRGRGRIGRSGRDHGPRIRPPDSF